MAYKKYAIDLETATEKAPHKMKIKTCLHMLGTDISSAMKKIPVYTDQFCAYAATMLTYKRASVKNPEPIDIVAAYAQASFYDHLLQNGATETMPVEKYTFNYGDFLKEHGLFPVARDLKKLAEPVSNIPAKLAELKNQAGELFEQFFGARRLREFDANLQLAWQSNKTSPLNIQRLD